MLEQIQTWIGYIKSVTRFEPTTLRIPSEDAAIMAPDYVIKEAYIWLNTIINTTYKDAYKIFTRTDPYMWDLMYQRNDKELREFKLLKSAIKNLKEALKSKPVFFRKTVWEGSKNEQTEDANAGKKSRKTRKANCNIESDSN